MAQSVDNKNKKIVKQDGHRIFLIGARFALLLLSTLGGIYLLLLPPLPSAAGNL